MQFSKEVTIFEGPDGAGKTTLAKAYAQENGARYVHFDNLPNAGPGLARMYVEAMLPAVLGYQPVVLDRCWLSEGPYGVVLRGGINRTCRADMRMIERLAYRCGAVVVRCQPAFETAEKNYLSRKHAEMLATTEELKTVYELYKTERSDLPMIIYDYENDKWSSERLNNYRTECHPLDLLSAGNWESQTIIVGDCFAHHEPFDALYQWPFASFSSVGCSRWLTNLLEEHKITEDRLCWANSDQDLAPFLEREEYTVIVALGNEAQHRLKKFKSAAEIVHFQHPQAWKRFHAGEAYPLIEFLQKEAW